MYVFIFYDDSHRAIQLKFIRSSLRKTKTKYEVLLGLRHLKVTSDFKMYSLIYKESNIQRG